MANQIQPPGFAQPNVQNNQNRFALPQGFNHVNNFNPEQSYQAPTQQNQIVPLNELKKVKRINEANMKAMQTQINMVKNKLRNEMKILIQASLSNQTNEIKNMMASLFQMNTASTSGSGSLLSNTVANPKGKLKAITTRSGIVIDGPTVHTPPLFINPEEDERIEETLTDPDLSEYTIKEFADELAFITFPPKYDDDLQFDIESNLKEIEFLLHQDIDSSLKDSIDQSNIANPADNFVDSMPEMFTDEHALVYSSPPIFDEYDDDFLEVESDTENVYDDPFD
nr:reverse transcriptase domain-containing protein [Tanacetum cinerariifolium]